MRAGSHLVEAARACCGLRASGASSACPYPRVLAQAAQIESTLFPLMASHGPHPPVRRHRRVLELDAPTAVRDLAACWRALEALAAGHVWPPLTIGGWPRLAAVENWRLGTFGRR
ncbi:hypothetical protein Ctob_015297 [Chrysochromulina tobinii]|uniref:Uncharacterized protein n=1 Tax=Chrysochromulina tobinii TaxID=1460289 RepID=A0A0M0K7D3_9EUKA|nr:hypothetical protein Ctob_015297 [Chrysochromulina tobinii]|eukprot:KOO34786.1 hypothetical protein Ctob_015297 [Chrysochromulina sp. CCMP291]